jgi:uncharacterized protein YndB with AHSA1/START domain
VTKLTITERVRLNASAQRIWRALTSADELVAWYAPGCRWEVSSLQPGAEVRFYNTETDVQSATIETADEPHHVTLRWRMDPLDPSVAILNSFVLRPEGSETEVTVAQGGYETLPPDVRQVSFEQDRGAVAAIASSLKSHVESRGIRPA